MYVQEDRSVIYLVRCTTNRERHRKERNDRCDTVTHGDRPSCARPSSWTRNIIRDQWMHARAM